MYNNILRIRSSAINWLFKVAQFWTNYIYFGALIPQAYVALSRATKKSGLQVLTSELGLQFEKEYVDNDCVVKTKIPSWLEVANESWGEMKTKLLNRADAQALRTYPKCYCKEENLFCRRVQVIKPGENHGRYFFSCSKGNHRILKTACNFFKWDHAE